MEEFRKVIDEINLQLDFSDIDNKNGYGNKNAFEVSELIINKTNEVGKIMGEVFFGENHKIGIPEVKFANLNQYIAKKGVIKEEDYVKFGKIQIRHRKIFNELTGNSEIVEIIDLSHWSNKKLGNIKFDMTNGVLGLYSFKENLIIFNQDYLFDNYWGESSISATLLHELFHWVQHNYGQYNSEEHCKALKCVEWLCNFEKYIQPWEDELAYRWQVVESDANWFSQFIYNSLKGK